MKQELLLRVHLLVMQPLLQLLGLVFVIVDAIQAICNIRVLINIKKPVTLGLLLATNICKSLRFHRINIKINFCGQQYTIHCDIFYTIKCQSQNSLKHLPFNLFPWKQLY